MQHIAIDGGGGAGGWGGDSHPAEEAQASEDRKQRLDGELHEGWEGDDEDYNFVYANGQFHISDSHDLHDLLDHTGAGPEHSGPVAVGRVNVDMGKATFEVASNVHAQGVARILKDYCKQVGWTWGGMTDTEGEPVGAGSEFAPVRSFYISAGRYPGEAIFSNQKIKGGVLGGVSGGVSGVVHVADHRAYVHRLDPAVFEGVKEWADDNGFVLVAGNDNVLQRIEDLEHNNIYSPEWNDADDHTMFQDPPDERKPGGVFKCPSCSQIFPSWGVYLEHRRSEEPLGDDTVDDSKFPTLDYDSTFPANSSEPLKFYEGRFGGEVVTPQGRVISCWWATRGDFQNPNFPSRERARSLERNAALPSEKPPEGKSMIQAPVPFIYDVQEDQIHVGSPGARHSDIQGKFTPGGLIEGTYEPKGKVFIRSMTNMPYTVRHMLELWYYQHPAFEITSVHLMDDAGKKTRLASMDVGNYIKAMVAANPTAWRVQKALQAAGGAPYAVGGAVRDAVMDKQPKDIDMMVTGLPPEEVRKVLARLPGRVDLTGKDFGVFRYKEDGGDEIEIALPRRERATGEGGHKDFDVQADHRMTPEEDLYRRDFTANAMAVNLQDGQLIDPFHGVKDVQERKLRTLNTKSLADDPLRVIRAMVALSRHGLYPDVQTKEQMTDAAEGIRRLPGERIQAELDKLFKGENPSEALRLADETGVLQHIFPEVARTKGYTQNNPHHELELFDHLLSVMDRAKERKPDDPDFALSGLLHDVGKPDSHWTECRDCQAVYSGHVKPCPQCSSENTSGHFYENKQHGVGANHEDLGADKAYEALFTRLKYPKERAERVRDLIQHHMFPAFTTERGARKFLQEAGPHADDLLDLRWADQGGKSDYPTDPSLSVDTQRALVNKARAENAPTQRAQLAINGSDLIAAGMQPGPEMGKALEALMTAVIDNPGLNTKEGLLGLVRGMGFLKTAEEKLPRVLYNKFSPQQIHRGQGPELPFVFDPEDDVVHLGSPNSYHWELIQRTPELRAKYPEEAAWTQAPALVRPDHIHGRLHWDPQEAEFYGMPTRWWDQKERVLRALQKGRPQITERTHAWEDEGAWDDVAAQ